MSAPAADAGTAGQGGATLARLRLHRRGGPLAPVPARARLLDASDVALVAALHRRVLALAPRPGLIKPERVGFFERHIEELGRIIGVFVADELVAYAVLGLPVDRSYNFGLALDLPEPELSLVAHLDGVSVAPQWRGNGLQRSLAAWRKEIARRHGRRHLLSTVAPHNQVSWRNMLDLGLKVRALQPMFGGPLRYLLHEDLAQPLRCATDRSIDVQLDDTVRQRALLASGFAGYAPLPLPGGPGLRYAPLVCSVAAAAGGAHRGGD